MMSDCICDGKIIIETPDIARGLTRLPRQVATFGDFRQALLEQIREYAALDDWRARDREDFGVMALEWWAYICDVIAFYNSEHTHNLYLRTALNAEQLHRLVQLVGYKPRPALGAQAVLAALVDGQEPVEALVGAGFISDSFDDSPPQEFELDETTWLDPLRNKWTVAPVRENRFDPKNLLLDPATRNLSTDALFVLKAGAQFRALQVKSIEREVSVDGENFQRLNVVHPERVPNVDVPLEQCELWGFTQQTPINSMTVKGVNISGIFPLLRKNNWVLIENTDTDSVLAHEFHRLTEVAYGKENLVADLTVESPTTILTLESQSALVYTSTKLHFNAVRGGHFISPAVPRLDASHFLNEVALADRHRVLNMEGTGEILLKGQRNKGVAMSATVDVEEPSGHATLRTSGASPEFEGTLSTPVLAYGNLLKVTRGKSIEENLGNGQGAGVPFQQFELSKKPLTYLYDSAAPRSRRSTLRLWIDGIEWHEVDNLFSASSTDRVFTVSLDSEGLATLTTGGDGYGVAPTSGSNNVFARYRYGAGDPAPIANSIQQIVGPVPKLRRVFNPIAGFGSSKADQPEDIKFNASVSAATFDRAISAADFSALALDFGALNAIATTQWVPTRLQTQVVVTVIFDGTPTTAHLQQLQSHLQSKCAETTPVSVIAARPVSGLLELSYKVSPDANPARVKEAMESLFLHPITGVFSRRRVAIGGPVFRSSILGEASKVAGVQDVVSLVLNGSSAPARIPIAINCFFDPELILTQVTG